MNANGCVRRNIGLNQIHELNPHFVPGICIGFFCKVVITNCSYCLVVHCEYIHTIDASGTIVFPQVLKCTETKHLYSYRNGSKDQLQRNGPRFS